MSAESRRHLTHRRTRFRSSSNNEQGSIDEEMDVMHLVYPNTPYREPVVFPAEKVFTLEIRPAGFIGLGFAMLFMGLHQYIWSSPGLLSRQDGNLRRLSLLFTIVSAATQFYYGLRDRTREDDGEFGFLFHCTYSAIWITMALPQLLLVLLAAPATAAGATDTVLSTPGRRDISVAASMLLMATAFTCLGFAIRARRIRHPALLLLLMGMGSAFLCFSRAQFQALHDAAAATTTTQHGGGLLVVSSLLAFRIAWRALEREMPCKSNVMVQRL